MTSKSISIIFMILFLCMMTIIISFVLIFIISRWMLCLNASSELLWSDHREAKGSLGEDSSSSIKLPGSTSLLWSTTQKNLLQMSWTSSYICGAPYNYLWYCLDNSLEDTHWIVWILCTIVQILQNWFWFDHSGHRHKEYDLYDTMLCCLCWKIRRCQVFLTVLSISVSWCLWRSLSVLSLLCFLD